MEGRLDQARQGIHVMYDNHSLRECKAAGGFVPGSRHEPHERYLESMSEPEARYLFAAPPIALMQCPVAGFQYHGGEACWGRLRIDDRLSLQREPGNRHDPRAISVKWQDVMLGYVPREANYALSQMMDRGAGVEARVASLREAADPWQRVMIEVMVHPAASTLPERPRMVERIVLSPPLLAANPPRLKLARAVGVITPMQRNTGLAVMRECVPEIAARLAQPVHGFAEGDRREVRLWDAVAVEIGADGRGLGARYLEGSAAGGPGVTLDLERPVGPGGWIACFVPAIAAVCGRHGLAKEDMPDPLRHWIGESLQLTFEGRVDFDALRKAAIDFLAPDPLARSLANRIFGGPPAAKAFNWVCERIPALALCAIEQPAMLPFLRIVQDDRKMLAAADPLAALRERLLAEKLDPAAWRKLARWGFGAFEAIGEAWWKPIPLARFARLLHRLEVQAPPPRAFVVLALRAAYHRTPRGAQLDFERHPPWFMRALLRELERANDRGQTATVEKDLAGCLDWLMDTRPEPDANQQRAGWPWILEQAQAYRKARELARAAPWTVPVAEMAWGPFRVIAIRCAAELAAEAEAMKNCLASYEEACRSGAVVVFSIRERSTGARIACFAAQRADDGRSWELVEAAGKMNAEVDVETERIGHAMVAKLNGGRGGDVAPF